MPTEPDEDTYPVNPDAPLGVVGNVGNSSGTWLHFEPDTTAEDEARLTRCACLGAAFEVLAGEDGERYFEVAELLAVARYIETGEGVPA